MTLLEEIKNDQPVYTGDFFTGAVQPRVRQTEEGLEGLEVLIMEYKDLRYEDSEVLLKFPGGGNKQEKLALPQNVLLREISEEVYLDTFRPTRKEWLQIVFAKENRDGTHLKLFYLVYGEGVTRKVEMLDDDGLEWLGVPFWVDVGKLFSPKPNIPMSEDHRLALKPAVKKFLQNMAGEGPKQAEKAMDFAQKYGIILE